MNRMDTGYKYDPLVLRHDSTQDKDTLLPDAVLENAKLQYKLICTGKNGRFPVWQDLQSGIYIGGLYHYLSDQEQLKNLYQIFKQDAQIRGYIETKDGNWAHSVNPFLASLSDSLPRHVWAYAYECGSAVFRRSRSLYDLNARLNY